MNSSMTTSWRTRALPLLALRAGAIVTAALLLLLDVAVRADAYALEGARWGGTPTSGCCANINVQYASSMYSIDRTAYDNARAKRNGSAANVNVFSGSGALTANDSYASTVAWDGLTYWATKSCTPMSCFTYANMYLNYYYTRNYSSSTIAGVAAHELGHALGLGHASGCVLMISATPTRQQCGVTGPQGDDVNGMNRLY